MDSSLCIFVGDRFRDFDIFFGDEANIPIASNSTPYLCHRHYGTIDSHALSVSCNRGNYLTRYVMVTLRNLAALSLCEVEVYAGPHNGESVLHVYYHMSLAYNCYTYFIPICARISS